MVAHVAEFLIIPFYASICCRTYPSSGQAAITSQLHYHKVLACHSRAAFEGLSWPDAKTGSLHAPSEAFRRCQLHQRRRVGERQKRWLP
jgi:hypothetical protein